MNPTRRIWLHTLALVGGLAAGSACLLGWLESPTLSPVTPPGNLLSLRLIPLLQLLFIAATALSLIATALPRCRVGARALLLAATGLAASLLLLISYENAHLLETPPAGGLFGLHLALTNLYHVSIAVLAITGTLALGYDRILSTSQGQGQGGTTGLLPFLTPLLAAGALFVGWLAGTGAATPADLLPALQNAILPFHVLANFVGYGCFAIAAAAAVALLLRQRADTRHRPSVLPSVQALENLSHRAIVLGFPVFSVAILLGCLWAYQAWGGYWSWDPKETWALIVWLLYAAYLHARAARAPRPTVLAWWLIIAFFATLFCYLGVNMFLSGLHSYGTLQG